MYRFFTTIIIANLLSFPVLGWKGNQILSTLPQVVVEENRQQESSNISDGMQVVTVVNHNAEAQKNVSVSPYMQ